MRVEWINNAQTTDGSKVVERKSNSYEPGRTHNGDRVFNNQINGRY